MRTTEYKADYPEWDGNGRSYKKGDRVRYAGIVYIVTKDHKSQPGCIPEGTPGFFEMEG